MQFSVIIPTLNEEKNIHRSIDSAAAGTDGEIIVVDGGSTDGTVKRAAALGAIVLPCEASRGRQMNMGAEKAVGEILLFLHADTTLPEGWPGFLRGEFVQSALQAGLFRSRFDNRHLLLRFCSFLTRYETRFTSFGDQCIVIRRSFFRQLGGFPEWPLFEDLRFLELARKRTKVRKFPLEGVTSARRFVRNGPAVQQMKNIGLVARYFIGGSPFLLARKYNGWEGKVEPSPQSGKESHEISVASSDRLSPRESS